jgi:hypothetical protein
MMDCTLCLKALTGKDPFIHPDFQKVLKDGLAQSPSLPPSCSDVHAAVQITDTRRHQCTTAIKFLYKEASTINRKI